MPDLCAVYTLAGLTFNDPDEDTYVTDAIDGLDGIPIRRTVVNLPQTDGGLAFPAFTAPRRITFEGVIAIRSIDPYMDRASYLAALNAAELGLWTTMDTLINATSALAWTYTGLGMSATLTVMRDEQPVMFRGTYPDRHFIVSMLATDPAIAIT
jgi:hypothetical protein